MLDIIVEIKFLDWGTDGKQGDGQIRSLPFYDSDIFIDY